VRQLRIKMYLNGMDCAALNESANIHHTHHEMHWILASAGMNSRMRPASEPEIPEITDLDELVNVCATKNCLTAANHQCASWLGLWDWSGGNVQAPGGLPVLAELLVHGARWLYGLSSTPLKTIHLLSKMTH